MMKTTMCLSDIFTSRMEKMKNAVESTLGGQPLFIQTEADRKLFYKAAKSLNLLAKIRKHEKGGWFAAAFYRKN